MENHKTLEEKFEKLLTSESISDIFRDFISKEDYDRLNEILTYEAKKIGVTRDQLIKMYYDMSLPVNFGGIIIDIMKVFPN